MKENNVRVVQQTADGSHTLFVPAMDEHYHSVNGAIQESLHVFINAGLRCVEKAHIRVLEIGFGTGLNALLTWKELETALLDRTLLYHTLELFPLDTTLLASLNYGEKAWSDQKDSFTHLHACAWGKSIPLAPRFTLYKERGDACSCVFPTDIDLIYFDAFAPDKQPELWEQQLFDRLYAAAAPGCIIVTYCAKGEVRRRMQTAGFRMQRLEGPPGKRHMLFGCKG